MSLPRVALLDYGSGNLHSAARALAHAGADVVVTADADVALAASGLVVPGVGAFAACMAGLSAIGGPDVVRTRLALGRPVLGICVGHQVMFSRGVEHGVQTDGICVLPGTVERLAARRLPHMGWNTLSGAGAAEPREWFYFVHSYAVRDTTGWPAEAQVAWASHGGDRFVAAVRHGALTSTQFHPEKSAEAGGRLLRRWVTALG